MIFDGVSRNINWQAISDRLPESYVAECGIDEPGSLRCLIATGIDSHPINVPRMMFRWIF
jgi:hypothetical protein